MSEEKNEELPIIELDDFDRNEEPINVGDGIEVITDNSLENYQQKLEEEKEEAEIELTSVELKKLLRIKLKKEQEFPEPVTNEMVAALTLEEIEGLKDIVKIRDRKELLKFVNRKSYVSDEEAEKLTDEEFLDLTNKALIMSRFLNYNTKKDFGSKYKKNRQRKNNTAKKSRAANRR